MRSTAVCVPAWRTSRAVVIASGPVAGTRAATRAIRNSASERSTATRSRGRSSLVSHAGAGGHPVRQHPAFLTGIGAPHGPRSSTRAPGGQVGHRRVFRRGCQAWDETDHSLIQNAEARDLPPELAPTFRHADEVLSASLRHILTLPRWLSTNKMVLFTT